MYALCVDLNRNKVVMRELSKVKDVDLLRRSKPLPEYYFLSNGVVVGTSEDYLILKTFNEIGLRTPYD